MITEPMTLARANEISGALVDAWMVQNGILDRPVPSFHGVTLAECEEATRIVQASDPIKLPNGGKTYTCAVNPSLIARLYAWAVLRSQA